MAWWEPRESELTEIRTSRELRFRAASSCRLLSVNRKPTYQVPAALMTVPAMRSRSARYAKAVPFGNPSDGLSSAHCDQTNWLPSHLADDVFCRMFSSGAVRHGAGQVWARVSSVVPGCGAPRDAD